MDTNQDYLAYEHFICQYHRESQEQTVWHWNFIPEEELFAAGFINNFNSLRLLRRELREEGKPIVREYGLDGMSLDKNGNYHGLQAKYWTSRTLTGHDLGTFMIAMIGRVMMKNPQSMGYLYHTCKLQTEVEYLFNHHPNFKNFLLPFTPNATVEQEQEIDETTLELYPPQQEALIEMQKGWEGLGLVSMPCALGKTVVLGNHLKQNDYKHIIILSPLRVLTKQMLERVGAFLPDYLQLLVDSDQGGTTDGEYVINRLKSKKNKSLISITYDSYEQIFMGKIVKNAMYVVDEAHNLLAKPTIVENLQLMPKVLLLTATPVISMVEDLDCTIVYSYLMSSAISNGYVCDYNINIPVLNLVDNVVDINIPSELSELDKDLTMKCLFLISGMLETGSRRCIIYCSNIEECLAFNSIFEKVCDKYHGIDYWTDVITADVVKRKRDQIMRDFQNNSCRLSILSSIRILNEGVNVVKCDSVFITRVGENQITAVQRLCRANRINKENPQKKANCFIWADDLNKTVGMLQYLKSNDEANFFQKIVVRSGNYEKKQEQEEIQKNVDYSQTISDTITISSMSVEEVWNERLAQCTQYMEDNHRRPTKDDDNFAVKTLGIWLAHQLHDYTRNEYGMRNPDKRKKLETLMENHKDCFLSNEEIWCRKLDEVSRYIDANRKKPSETDKDETTKKLGNWINRQVINYSKEHQIMENKDIRKKLEVFLEKYQQHFQSHDDVWDTNLKDVIDYMVKNKKRPSKRDGNDDVKRLGNWVSQQIQNYEKNVKGMKDETRRTKWENFVDKYQDYLMSDEDLWKKNLLEVGKYIDQHKKRPSPTNQDEKIQKLGNWISKQLDTYPKQTKIMNNPEFRKLWEDFVKKHQKHFLTVEEIWKNNHDKLVAYLEEHKKRPSCSSKDESTQKLANWLVLQPAVYRASKGAMKNENVRKMWEDFTEKYKTIIKK